MGAAWQAGGTGRGVVDVPLKMKDALRRAEHVLNSRGDLQHGAGYVEVTSRNAAGFDYRVYAMVHFSYNPGNHGSVRAVQIDERWTRVTFHETPARHVKWLYVFGLIPLLAIPTAPDQGSAIWMFVFGAGIVSMLYGLTRYVLGKVGVMARELAARTGGRLAGASN